MSGENERPVVCVKIGGRALEDASTVGGLAKEIVRLNDRYRCVTVHGGGAEISRISGVFGLSPEFRDGVRMTRREEMQVVDMVLAGLVNTSLVRAIGPKAVGVSGCDAGLFVGESIAPDSHTGHILEPDPHILNVLMGEGWIPVVSSVSASSEGVPLNINADEAALSVSRSLHAKCLVFISDIDGVLKDHSVVPVLFPSTVESAIREGVITGGMIPKVRASVAALNDGVDSISIGSFEHTGDLLDLIDGKRGSSIQKEQ